VQRVGVVREPLQHLPKQNITSITTTAVVIMLMMVMMMMMLKMITIVLPLVLIMTMMMMLMTMTMTMMITSILTTLSALMASANFFCPSSPLPLSTCSRPSYASVCGQRS
jgi:hypothetical protein